MDVIFRAAGVLMEMAVTRHVFNAHGRAYVIEVIPLGLGGRFSAIAHAPDGASRPVRDSTQGVAFASAEAALAAGEAFVLRNSAL